MLITKNRKAFYDYEIGDKFLAGIVLKGHEVKAIREHKANLKGSYVEFDDGELFVTGMHIGRYSKKSQKHSEEDSRRKRKLLLSGRELKELSRALEIRGNTAVPLALVLKNNMVKLEFGLAKGRKKYDKRKYLKRKQIEENIRKESKGVI